MKLIEKVFLSTNIAYFLSIDGNLLKTLIRLDVSENRLNPDDIYILSKSKLEELYLSVNNLTEIPENITDHQCFLSLKFLDLSDNCFSSSRIFYLLSTLHNLQVLNMATNRISFIPYLVTEQVRFYYYRVDYYLNKCFSGKDNRSTYYKSNQFFKIENRVS